MVASIVDEVVLGDVMNTAARLEQMAEPGTTLVGPRTVELLTRSFNLEPMPPIEAKGKTDLVAAYRLLGASPEPTHLAVDLVRRTEELSFLRQLLDKAHDEGSPESRDSCGRGWCR